MRLSRRALNKIIESYLNEVPEEMLGDVSVDKKDVPVETEKKKVDKDLQYWHKIHDEINYAFDWKIMGDKQVDPSSGVDMVVGKCKQDACAQWVSDSFGKSIRIGNAWPTDRDWETLAYRP